MSPPQQSTQEEQPQKQNSIWVDLQNKIVDNKELIFGVATFGYCLYQLAIFGKQQSKLQQQLNETIERVKELDLSMGAIEEFTKRQAAKQRQLQRAPQWMRKK